MESDSWWLLSTVSSVIESCFWGSSCIKGALSSCGEELLWWDISEVWVTFSRLRSSRLAISTSGFKWDSLASASSVLGFTSCRSDRLAMTASSLVCSPSVCNFKWEFSSEWSMTAFFLGGEERTSRGYKEKWRGHTLNQFERSVEHDQQESCISNF